MIRAVELVFPNEHHLSITFSTTSTDVFLSQTTKTDGKTVVTVFHTDPSLVLRAAASGESDDNLQLIVNDGSVAADFREVLSTWERLLP